MSGQDPTYKLLRHLTPPIAAITTSADGRRNGLIVNSAQRASLIPTAPRICLYISKTNFSHDLIYGSGLFGVHLLRPDQWHVVRALGLRSARDVADKLADLPTRDGVTGIPMLDDVHAGFECRVVNAMDAGAATFFLGDVLDVRRGSGENVMTSAHFRANAPRDLLEQYEAGLVEAQRALAQIGADIRPCQWDGGTLLP